MFRWQNLCDYRSYTDHVLSGQSPRGFSENLTSKMKRSERIALSLRTREGVAARELNAFREETREFMLLGLLRKSNGNFLLTRKGKSLADSVTGALM
jgi:coproporphyrinogen III oxidase-like Fe-S oxidoreductase